MLVRPFAAFLSESLDVLEREVPAAWDAMACALAGRAVELDVDGERVVVCSERGRVAIGPGAVPVGVRVVTRRETVLDLIDGRTTLLDAVFDETLAVRGSPADLLAFLDGLAAYLQGAVRGPSFGPLLRRYRGERSMPKALISV